VVSSLGEAETVSKLAALLSSADNS